MLLGGNPTTDKHPLQGGVAIFLGILHSKETGISSWLFGPLARVRPYLYFLYNLFIFHSHSKRTKNDLRAYIILLQVLHISYTCILFSTFLFTYTCTCTFNRFCINNVPVRACKNFRLFSTYWAVDQYCMAYNISWLFDLFPGSFIPDLLSPMSFNMSSLFVIVVIIVLSWNWAVNINIQLQSKTVCTCSHIIMQGVR